MTSDDSDLSLSDFRISELEELKEPAQDNRQEPIPLDVIASELRRQSQAGVDLNAGRSPARGHSAQPIMDPIPAPKLGGGDAPLISENELQVLMQDNEPSQQGSEPRKSADVLDNGAVAQVVRRESTSPGLRRAEAGGNPMGATAESSGDEVHALRRELELVRAKAAQDVELMRQQLQAGSDQAGDAARNVELEAELQALRQESSLLRHAVQEKDKVLEDLASQCRGLEDVLEDRDREMDRLNRELEQVQGGESSMLDMGAGSDLDAETELSYTYKTKDSAEILDGPGLVYMPGSERNWRHIGFSVLAGLVACLILLEVLFMMSGRGEMFSSLMSGAEVDPAAATVRREAASPPTSRAEPVRPAPVKPAVAQSEPTPAPVRAEPKVQKLKPRLVQDRLRGGGLGPVLVVLPGGSFTMGDKLGLLSKDERPAHEVELGPFAIGRSEVSFEEYDRFARATGRPLPDDEGRGRGKQPVVNISWDEASAYVEWLSAQTGKPYRLPSESQWEFAARGGTRSRFWWGYEGGQGNAVCLDCGSQWDARAPAPVGSLSANPYGLHDTAGNVMEWVSDCYNGGYQGAPADGSAWLEGQCGQRVVRGGAYNKPISSLRSSARYRLPKASRFETLGFRVVRQ